MAPKNHFPDLFELVIGLSASIPLPPFIIFSLWGRGEEEEVNYRTPRMIDVNSAGLELTSAAQNGYFLQAILVCRVGSANLGNTSRSSHSVDSVQTYLRLDNAQGEGIVAKHLFESIKFYFLPYIN